MLLQNNNASFFLALICDEFEDVIEYARKNHKINRKKAVIDLIEKNALSSGLDSANILTKEEYDLLIRYIELCCSVIASQ